MATQSEVVSDYQSHNIRLKNYCKYKKTTKNININYKLVYYKNVT